MKPHSYYYEIGLFAGIGIVGAFIAGNDFEPGWGGLVGLFVSIMLLIKETIETPKNDRNRHFGMFVRGGPAKGYVNQDVRIVIPFMFLMFGTISTIIVQVIYFWLAG